MGIACLHERQKGLRQWFYVAFRECFVLYLAA